MAGLDYSTLEIQKATMPKKRGGRTAGPNPFGPVVAESFKDGEARAVVVPNGTAKNKAGEWKNVAATVSLIRRAAMEKNVGVSIALESGKTSTKVIFKGKKKKAAKQKNAQAKAA